ncbi:MAG TPA: GNAT family N-acetyltransferase [Acetobacteraceae bacterium]|jgi:hypothetical protein
MTGDGPPRLETFASPEALPPDTGVLFSAAPDLFSTRAWWDIVLAHAMPEGARPCFLLCRLGALPAALIPLRYPPVGRALSSLTTPYTCRYAPLLHPSLDASARRAVFAAFGRFCRDWATTRLDALPADWPALADCIEGAKAAGLVVRRFDHFGNWHEPVGDLGWSGYLASRPGALRETIRRRLRRAERNPDARFSVVAGGKELDAGIAAFESVYARSWKEPEPFARFNAALMRQAAVLGVLRLGVLWTGAQPAAAQFWIVEGGTATVLKLAHDEALKGDSPGTVLTALMLRRLLDEEHVGEIDFGRGDDGYKQGWAAQRRQRIGLVLANPRRIEGLAFLARHAAGRARSWLRRTGS